MPDLLLKAPVFGRIAKASRVPGANTNPLLDQIIDRLEADPTQPQNRLAQIAIDFGFYKDAQHAEHLAKHWLDDPPGTGFWPGILEVEEIIRKGMALALKKFRETGRPLEFFWVISGDQNSDRFEMSVSLCRKVIVVMFHTPQVPCNVPTKFSDRIWLARKESGSVITRAALVPDVPQPVSAAKVKAAKKKPRVKQPKKPKGPGPKKRR
jgi:hypothetical protein